MEVVVARTAAGIDCILHPHCAHNQSLVVLEDRRSILILILMDEVLLLGSHLEEAGIAGHLGHRLHIRSVHAVDVLLLVEVHRLGIHG